jgi:hypothetical protein
VVRTSSITIDTSGLDELRRRIEKLSRGQKVSFSELFPPEFMRKYTDFGTIDALVQASGYTVETAEDFAKIPDEAWDQFIKARTRFSSWSEMQNQAGSEWAARQLGFKK